MIVAFSAIALAGEPPPGVAGEWRLSRVETAEETWEYAAKVEEWAKFARDRCHEIERLLTFRGEEVEIAYRWSCSEPGLGTYVSVRSLSVAAQWSGNEIIVPPAEGFGRFVRLQPPDPTLGRRTVAILPATERQAQLGPMTWQVALIEPPPRSKEPAQLRLTRKSGEIWTLVPATPPAEPPK